MIYAGPAGSYLSIVIRKATILKSVMKTTSRKKEVLESWRWLCLAHFELIVCSYRTWTISPAYQEYANIFHAWLQRALMVAQMLNRGSVAV